MAYSSCTTTLADLRYAVQSCSRTPYNGVGYLSCYVILPEAVEKESFPCSIQALFVNSETIQILTMNTIKKKGSWKVEEKAPKVTTTVS